MNNNKEHKKIGKWLREKRERARLTQAQLANLIGRHESYVGRYEAGHRLELAQFFKIAAILEAEPAEVIRTCVENNPR